MKNVLDIVGADCGSVKQSIANLTIHQFAESLGNAIDAKDHCTCSHSEEVAVVAQALGVEIGMPEYECELLHIAGHLHDIGKIGLPDSILKKKGRLSDYEYEMVKKHPVIGAEIVKPIASVSEINRIARIILHHHERFDGKGYPYGLKGKDIPFGARIIAVADTLSAMASDRPYRLAIDFNEIIDEIKSCSGTQFDPKVVDAFLRIADKVELYFDKNNANSEEAFTMKICRFPGQDGLHVN